MAKVSLKAGTTSYIANVFIQDSTSTTGAGKTGLAYNTASLTAYYVLPGAAAAAITLATQTTTGGYSSGGFVEIDSTNMPGAYRLDIPNACLAANNKSCLIMLKGATGMAPLALEIELTANDNQDSVRGGMTALPNAAAGANTGLPVVGTQIPNATAAAVGGLLTAPTTANVGLADLSRILGTALTETTGQIAAAFKQFFNIASPTSTMNQITLVDTTTTLTNAPSDSSGTTTMLSRLTSTRAGYLDNLSGGAVALASGVNVTQWKGSTAPAMTGDAFARLGAPSGASVSEDVAAIKAQIAAIETDTGTDIPATLTTIAGYLDTEIAAIYSRLGAPAGASMSADIAAIKTQTAAIETDTQDIQSRLPSALTGDGYMKADALAWAGAATATNDVALATAPTNFAALAITAGGAVTAGTVSDKTGYTLTQSFPTNFGSLVISAGGIVQADVANWKGSTAPAMTGDAFARLGAPAGASIAADIAAVLAKWTTAITESYASDGSAPTPEQALMMTLQSLHEFSIAGTTRTVKKLDGSTTAMTFTLDSATAPTSTTRAT